MDRQIRLILICKMTEGEDTPRLCEGAGHGREKSPKKPRSVEKAGAQKEEKSKHAPIGGVRGRLINEWLAYYLILSSVIFMINPTQITKNISSHISPQVVFFYKT